MASLFNHQDYELSSKKWKFQNYVVVFIYINI